jgi:putative Mg2+ transporter-C (MgtC) family protein
LVELELELALRLVLSVALGAIVGLERELTDKPAGLRTHMLVSLGSCLFTVVSIYDFSVDPARIAAGIVAGIGFIGAGTILAGRDRVIGITTAASLWTTAAVGLAVGVGSYVLAVITTALVFAILFMRKIPKK